MPAARKMLPFVYSVSSGLGLREGRSADELRFNVVKALQRFKSKKGKSVEVQEEKKDIVWV